MSFRRLTPIALVLLAATNVACEKRPTRSDIEWETASRITSLLKLYETANSGVRMTNLAQLFAAAGKPYPYSWHKKFQRFGDDAGFENSIFEKYVFPPPNVRSRYLEGEILVLNAAPFRDTEKHLRRMVITRAGSGLEGFRTTWLHEETIQAIFRDSGIPIPRPITMPLPPPEPPPSDAAFRKAAEKDLEEAIAEYERRYPTPLWRKPQWQAAGAVLLLAILAAGGWWFRRRKRF